MAASSSIIRDNLHFLDQAIQLLQQIDGVPMTESEHPSGYPGGIGPHLRHCIDHYHCFLHGVADQRIDYNARARNPKVEQDPLEAIAQVRGIREALVELAEHDLDGTVESRMDCGDDDSWSHSTVKRELQFLISHTVHHYAIVAILLRQQSIEPPNDFGVAPSTIKHHQANLTCAP